jgi:hypothetical protein
MRTPKGFVLSTNDQITVIATLKTSNRKTGNMVQIWILPTHISPVEAINTGKDSVICGNCPHRGSKTQKHAAGGYVTVTERPRTCYVNVGQAPNSVWKGFRRGIYPYLPTNKYSQAFAGRAIRLGAYGDPAFVSADIISALVSVATKHTGYTHQWRTNEWLKPFVMASCDTLQDYLDARTAGWRTFRVSAGLTPMPNEILCPASKEAGNKTVCAKCGLCAGTSKQAKNIFIPVHGSGAKNALVILQ